MTRTFLHVLAVSAVTLAACAPRPATPRPEAALADPLRSPPGVVDGPTGAALARAGALVVDVRTAQEFAAGHVPGAVNVPFDELPRRAAELGPPGTPIVLYCRSGRRSGIAGAALRAAGYEKVWDAQRIDTWPRGTDLASR